MPSSSASRDRSTTGTHVTDQKLLLRFERDFDETASIASNCSRVSRSSISTRSSGRSIGGNPGSLATSCVSLRDLELRKAQIESELARVQQELQLRELQQAAAQLPAKLQRK